MENTKIGDVFIVKEYYDMSNEKLENIFICTVNEISTGNAHSIVNHVIIGGHKRYNRGFTFQENKWDKQIYFKMKRLEKDYKKKYPEYFI